MWFTDSSSPSSTRVLLHPPPTNRSNHHPHTNHRAMFAHVAPPDQAYRQARSIFDRLYDERTERDDYYRQAYVAVWGCWLLLGVCVGR